MQPGDHFDLRVGGRWRRCEVLRVGTLFDRGRIPTVVYRVHGRLGCPMTLLRLLEERARPVQEALF